MFTGLVESIGILRRRNGSTVVRALIETTLGSLAPGESINVNGACLTVDRQGHGGFECDLSSETLDKTTLGGLPVGCRVHLERATPLGGRMGGHIVLGHVDGLGTVTERVPMGQTVRLGVRCSKALAPYLASKGSIAIDGVSLTLNKLGMNADGVLFDVMLVPHTLERTMLGSLRPESLVNLEVDILARYVARQLQLTEREHVDKVVERDGNDDERLLAKLRSGGFW